MLRKAVILALLLVAVAPVASAQWRGEFGGSLGFGFGASRMGLDDVSNGFLVDIEGRGVNLRKRVGIGLNIRSLREGDRETRYEMYDFTSYSFMVVGDFFPVVSKSEKLLVYVGLGLGVAVYKNDSVKGYDRKSGICMMPRVGIRIFKHMDLGVEYNILQRANRQYSWHVGFYF